MNLRNLHKYFFRAKERDPDDSKESSIFEKLFSEIWKRSSSPKSLGTGSEAVAFNRPNSMGTTTDSSDYQSESFLDKNTKEHIVTNDSEVFMEIGTTPSDVDPTLDAGNLYFGNRSNPSFDKSTLIQPIVDYLSDVLDKIRADIFYIDHWEEPENTAPYIGRLRACVAEEWKKIEMCTQNPTEFLGMWGRVEDFQKCIHDIRLSIEASKMTENLAYEFCGHLSGFGLPNVNTSHRDDDGPPHPLQAPSTYFFKDVQKANISGGNFAMNGPQTVVTGSSAQSEIYLKQIRDGTYLRTVVEIVFLF